MTHLILCYGRDFVRQNKITVDKLADGKYYEIVYQKQLVARVKTLQQVKDFKQMVGDGFRKDLKVTCVTRHSIHVK